MGFSFQRRLNFGAGLGLNISKSRVSPFFRTRGGSISTRGFSLRTGIPGLTYRQRWSAKPEKAMAGLIAVLLVFCIQIAVLLLKIAIHIAWFLTKLGFNILCWLIFTTYDFLCYVIQSKSSKTNVPKPMSHLQNTTPKRNFIKRSSTMNFEVKKNNVNENLPLIYMWEIFDKQNSLIGRYIGKAKNGSSRPLNDYRRNVDKIFKNKPYRKSNPDGFRRVHKALADAVRNHDRIVLTLMCNVPDNETIDQCERRHISEYNSSGTESYQLND